MNIAVISNSESHVETSLFIYSALKQIAGVCPVIIPLKGDLRGLRSALELAEIKYTFKTYGKESQFDLAVIVTTYPFGLDMPTIPLSAHPFIKAFSERRILISHRTNKKKTDYPSGEILCLSPLSEPNGIPHLYPCDNPLLGHNPCLQEQPIRLLIQGKFDYNHRDLMMINLILDNFPTQFHLVFLGMGSNSIGFDDPRVSCYHNLTEIEFYQIADSCHFLLPLISLHTRGGSYTYERFSSSLGISFSALKPSIVHISIQNIYHFSLGYSYENESDFVHLLYLISENPLSDTSKRNIMIQNRNFMRKHNRDTFINSFMRINV